MNSKTKYAILLVSSVVVVYAIIGGMMGRASAQNGSYQQLSIFMEVINRIQNDYVDDPSMTDAFAGGDTRHGRTRGPQWRLSLPGVGQLL